MAESTATIPEEAKVAKIPDDFWATVEGYEDIREVFLASLKADSPVHILLVGDPATGKSVMLMEVERLAGSVFVTAGTATHVGLRDILVDRKPRYLIIDELDKVRDPKDLSVLLTLMETGRVIVAKHKELREERLKTWVFAACNNTKNLPPELLDRFLVFHLKPYDKETLKKVIVKALTMREGVERELAEYIADKVANSYGSVRDAVKLARLAKTREEVDKLWGIVLKYRKTV
jgi:MoxR-like ATPase